MTYLTRRCRQTDRQTPCTVLNIKTLPATPRRPRHEVLFKLEAGSRMVSKKVSKRVAALAMGLSGSSPLPPQILLKPHPDFCVKRDFHQ